MSFIVISVHYYIPLHKYSLHTTHDKPNILYLYFFTRCHCIISTGLDLPFKLARTSPQMPLLFIASYNLSSLRHISPSGPFTVPQPSGPHMHSSFIRSTAITAVLSSNEALVLIWPDGCDCPSLCTWAHLISFALKFCFWLYLMWHMIFIVLRPSLQPQKTGSSSHLSLYHTRCGDSIWSQHNQFSALWRHCNSHQTDFFFVGSHQLPFYPHT